MAGEDGWRLEKEKSEFILHAHREKRHTTKQCRVLKFQLEQLVKAGHLKEFLVVRSGENEGQELGV